MDRFSRFKHNDQLACMLVSSINLNKLIDRNELLVFEKMFQHVKKTLDYRVDVDFRELLRFR